MTSQPSSSSSATSSQSQPSPSLTVSTDRTESTQSSTASTSLPISSTSSIPFSPDVSLSFPENAAHAHAAERNSSTSPPRNHFRERSIIRSAGFDAAELSWECKEGEGLQLRQEDAWNEAERGRESGEWSLLLSCELWEPPS